MELIEDTCSKSDTELTKPDIVEEEDKPFFNNQDKSSDTSADSQVLMKLEDQKHSHSVEDFKNTTGKHILYWCLGAVAISAGVDIWFHPDSAIFTSAVDLAKVVATTILGYLFGSKSK